MVSTFEVIHERKSYCSAFNLKVILQMWGWFFRYIAVFQFSFVFCFFQLSTFIFQFDTFFFIFFFFFGAAPTDCTQDLTPGQQLSHWGVFYWGPAGYMMGLLTGHQLMVTWYQPSRGRPSED